MGEITLSTKDSLYEDITVNLDDVAYKCKKFTKDVMDQYLEFEDNMTKASDKKDSRLVNKLVYEEVKYLFPSLAKEKDKIDKLHARELFDIITLVENCVSAKKEKPKTEKEKKEKNGSKPGDKPSP